MQSIEVGLDQATRCISASGEPYPAGDPSGFSGEPKECWGAPVLEPGHPSTWIDCHHQSLKGNRDVSDTALLRGNHASSRPSSMAADRQSTPSSPAS